MNEYFKKPEDLEKQAEEELLRARRELVAIESQAIDHYCKILMAKLKGVIGDKKITLDPNNLIDQMVTQRISNKTSYEEIIDTIVNMYSSYFG